MAAIALAGAAGLFAIILMFGKIVTVTADDHSFRLEIDGEPVAVVARTTGREIHRYKAHATQQARTDWTARKTPPGP